MSAEGVVANWLITQGFCLVARNLRLGHLELDIVARRDELVVVVEVRARSAGSYTTAFGSISATKRERIRCAARRLWRARYANDPTVQRLRIDAAAVHFGPSGPVLEYCPGAF